MNKNVQLNRFLHVLLLVLFNQYLFNTNDNNFVSFLTFDRKLYDNSFCIKSLLNNVIYADKNIKFLMSPPHHLVVLGHKQFPKKPKPMCMKIVVTILKLPYSLIQWSKLINKNCENRRFM